MKLFTINTKHMVRMFSALIAILLISVQLGQAQSQTVTGVVLDENSNPIIGANVIIKGTTSGVTTGIDGDFVLSVAPNSVLEFSYIGYRTVEETVSAARTSLEVTMMPSAVDLDEVVVVGYGTQSRVSVTGAVVSIKAEELETVATSNVGTALTGHMPGVTVIQNSGWAGDGASSINIRGVSSDSSSDPLVLVDGFERSLDDLDMNEVDNISVLKDASATAMYGVRGANGVIIITTKKGQASDKIRFNFKAEGGVNIMSNVPEVFSSAQYAELYNEALTNDASVGGTINGTMFTDAEIELYKNGTSIAYPNPDYQSFVFHKAGYQHKYTLSMSGGNDRVKYYNSISYNYQKDALRDYGDGYDASSWYDRINVRSNIDAKLTNTTTLSLNIGAQFATRNQPNITLNNITTGMAQSAPGLKTMVDGKVAQINVPGSYYASGGNGKSQIYELVYDAGYKNTNTNKLQSTFAINQDLSMITKGLTADVFYAYDNSNYTVLSFTNETPLYQLTSTDPVTLVAPTTTEEYTPARTMRMNSVESKFRAMLNYNRRFNNAHNVTVLTVFNLTDKSFHTGDYSYVPYRTLEVAGKIAYEYKSRYFADVNVGVSGSENFHPDYRYGVFPAFSAGWVISNEEFFPKNNVLSFLKLKGSYGITGNDQGTSRFYYSGEFEYDATSGYYFGDYMQGNSQGTSTESRTGNDQLTWETNKQINVGINTQWFQNRLVLDAEYFYNYRSDILQEPTAVAGTVGLASYAMMNMKEISTRGYEIAVNWSDNIGKLTYSIGGNMSFYENRLEEQGELPALFDWQYETGRTLGQYYGYQYDGLYTQAEIDQLQAAGGSVDGIPTAYGLTPDSMQAGDVKYKDLDGDGQINSNDQKYFDNLTVPPYSFAANMSLNYKGWGFSMLWQGTTGSYYEFNDYLRVPFQAGTNNASTIHLDRWTPETADTAKYPRISQSGTATSNNYVDSDLWLEDASYIRLKNIEFSYKFSAEKLKKLRLESLRIYASAYNLVTFTGLDFTDPETESGSTSVALPPNKVINLGVQVSF